MAEEQHCGEPKETSPVIFNVKLDGIHVGNWIHEEPVDFGDGWRGQTREEILRFLRNDGTWCANDMQNSGDLYLREGASIPFDPVDSGVCSLCMRIELIPVVLS